METLWETGAFAEKLRVRATCGEILPTGEILDLVAAADGEGLDLLRWDATQELVIAPRIECGGVLYHPAKLHPSILQAMRFPNGAAEYGTDAELFGRIAGLYREYADLPEDLAAYTTCFTLASAVPELLPIPLTLCVSGAPVHQIHKLFGLIRELWRRGLRVAELNRRLPFFLHPTLMVDDPRLSGKARAFWVSASRQGMFVAGAGDTVRELACSKVVLSRPEDPEDAWGEDAMHLVLPHAELPTLSNDLLTRIAAEFQPQLEMFRLRHLSGVDPFVSATHPLARFDLARNLGACIPEDPGIIQLLTPLFESYQQDISAQRSRDPRVAILEAIWSPSHDQEEMTVGEITKRVDAILRSRGVNQDHNVRQIGWKLRDLALYSTSNGKCKVLRFSGQIREGIHEWVQEFRLQLPFRKDCSGCQALQAPDKKSDK
jgi:hypothetical protein